jgi:hypothetical protein
VIALAFLAAAGGYLLRDAQNLEPRAWSHCVDVASGYDVQYPSDWSSAEGPIACRLFDPEPFTVPPNSDFGGTALEVLPQQESFDDALASLIDTRFFDTELREQITIAGGSAFRLELVATGQGFADRGTRTYAYLIPGDSGRSVLVQTTAQPGDRIRHRDVVDHAAQTLRIFPTPTEPAGVSALPAAVEEKRDAILAAIADDDVEAVAALADDPFSYTFGGPVEGGPASYWRRLEAEGEDPLGELELILRMPYTLATGHYVWPFAYDKTADTITDYERELLEPLETTFVGEGYLGWRAGFLPDGRWVFFVAGD